MLERPFGIILLGAALLTAGLAGIAAFSMALVSWLTTSGTSPLAQLVALAWSGTYIVTVVLTWRRSWLSARAFLVSMGFLALVLWFILPGHELFLLLPSFGVTFLFAFLGHRYIRRECYPLCNSPIKRSVSESAFRFEDERAGKVSSVRLLL